MSQTPLSEFPETIPGVEFAPVSDLQAIRMLYTSVVVANGRGAYKFEETVALYPCLKQVMKLFKNAAAQQTQASDKSVETTKTVTLAPTVKSDERVL